MRNCFTVLAAATAAFTLGAPALAAVPVPDGTVTFVALFNPTANYSTNPATATFTGQTFEISGTGGFSSAAGLTGALAGTISFSDTPGVTIDQSINNFFTFGGGLGSTFAFSLSSVLTQSYSVNPDVSQSFSLYLLGTTLNTGLGYDSTPTSLTLTFNQTGNSGYSASGTLAVPPDAPAVPEPATWGLFILGFGAIGAGLRGQRVRVSYRTA